MSDITAIIRSHARNHPQATVTAIRSAPAGWARYCIDNGHNFRTYTLGYELLTGADCTDQGSIWLQRGFAALAEHVGRL